MKSGTSQKNPFDIDKKILEMPLLEIMLSFADYSAISTRMSQIESFSVEILKDSKRHTDDPIVGIVGLSYALWSVVSELERKLESVKKKVGRE